MSIEALIKQKIEEHFAPVHFEIINESDRHIGHAGYDGIGDSHFKLIIVSSAFKGYNRVQKHRMVVSVLTPLFSQGLHALSLDLQATDE
ncbi:MAG: BolA family transcriptional regulator [Alphaproteobacteria bacterium]|nr:BolA family transcriptional regulator [Alphaproteobacteria bacterium]